jgi:hypothetical protein
MVRRRTCLSVAVFLMSIAIYGCGTPSSGRSGEGGGGEEPALISIRTVQVRGVAYRVGRPDGSGNFFVVSTSGDRPGSRWGASTAVMTAFNCQRVSLTPLDDRWRRAEGRGSFCNPSRSWDQSR